MTQSQNQNQNRGRGGGAEKKIPPSTFRKTIKRPLAQQQKQEQPNLESMQSHSQPQSQSQSRVANFMSKLNAVKTTNYLQGDGDDGTNGSETDLADYQPINSNYSNEQGGEQGGDNNNDDGVVTRENFETLPSTYASQYYQQYAPLSYSGQQPQSQG